MLEEEPDRTRSQLADGLRERGVDTDGQSLMILLAHLELDQVICSGRPLGDEHTYALFAERVPSPRRLDRDEALGELARRYFTGHGPATERDLAYWATLTLTDVRRGDRGRRRPARVVRARRAHVLARARTSRRGTAASPPRTCCRSSTRCTAATRTRGGCSMPRASCRAPARPRSAWRSSTPSWSPAMKRTVTAARVVFELSPHRPLRPRERTELRRAADRYGAYLGLPAVLEVAEPEAAVSP